VAFIQPNNLVVPLGIHQNHRSKFLGRGQTIDSVDLKPQHISATGIPGDRPALADVAKEMMFRSGGKLLDSEFEFRSFDSEGGDAANGKYKKEEVNASSLPQYYGSIEPVLSHRIHSPSPGISSIQFIS